MKLWQRYNTDNDEALTLDERAFEYFLITTLNMEYQGQVDAYMAIFRKNKEKLNQEESEEC